MDENKLVFTTYRKELEKAREIARSDAQSAFENALEEKKGGNYRSALGWIERAHRLANNNPSIDFERAMIYWKLADLSKASTLFTALMRDYDFLEGWLSLVLISALKKNRQDTLFFLNKILSSYGISQFIWSTLTRALEKMGFTGYCCMDGASGLIRVNPLNSGPISVFLDNHFQFTSTSNELALPKHYSTGQRLSIRQNGKHLYGSPIHIVSIIKTESFVEFDKESIKGWIWFPMQPERLPKILIHSNHDAVKEMQVSREIDKNTLDRPFFRPRSFSFSHKGHKKKLFFLKDEYGNQLLGSPLSTQISNIQYFDIVNKSDKMVFGQGNLSIGQHSRLSIKKRPIVVIIPVYGGFSETLECLRNVIMTLTPDTFIQIVNDDSKDKELISNLTKLVDNKQIFLTHHKENLGFPSAVNTGIKLWPEHDIILLNSDTLVPYGWIETMQSVAYARENIGTVTPFSNNAGIFSYPSHEIVNPFPSLDDINRYTKAMRRVGKIQYIEIPTGYGFCMFLKRDCLEETGLFREDVFSQGYGEENDFCMRARMLGWFDVLATGLYVGHKGGVSFGASNIALMKRNYKILNLIHPLYDQLIKDFVAKDPIHFIRRQIDQERLQEFLVTKTSQKKGMESVLIITHGYGGGVERSVQERINQILLKNYIAVVLRPDLSNKGCKLDLFYNVKRHDKENLEDNYPNFRYSLPKEYSHLCEQLSLFHIQWIEIHHFIGHHDKIHDLLRDINKPCDFFIHDYYVFCPRITLINDKRKLCNNFKNIEICQNCLLNFKKNPDEPISIDYWLKRSAQDLLCARRVYTPSQDALKRVAKCFPDVNTLLVSPLEDDKPNLSLKQLAYFSLKVEKTTSSYLIHKKQISRICIIGAIGVEKGFHVIKKLLKDADGRNLPVEYVLVGWSANDRQLLTSKRMYITGSYSEDEAVELVAQQEADYAFFPNIWPETWCYTLSIAWRAGLKAVSFDIGAIAERIKSTKRGHVLPYGISIPDLNDSLIQLCR